MQSIADFNVLDAESARNAATVYYPRSYDSDALAAFGRVIDDG